MTVISQRLYEQISSLVSHPLWDNCFRCYGKRIYRRQALPGLSKILTLPAEELVTFPVCVILIVCHGSQDPRLRERKATGLTCFFSDFNQICKHTSWNNDSWKFGWFCRPHNHKLKKALGGNRHAPCCSCYRYIFKYTLYVKMSMSYQLTRPRLSIKQAKILRNTPLRL